MSHISLRALAFHARTTALPQVPAEARPIEAVCTPLDETAAAEDSSRVQSDSKVQELVLWALICPCSYLPVQMQVPIRARSGTGLFPPLVTSSAPQPPSVAWPDAMSPEGEHQKIVAEMASALDAS